MSTAISPADDTAGDSAGTAVSLGVGRQQSGRALSVVAATVASMTSHYAIEAEDLVKHFGETVAVDGVSFVVPQGSVLGLLGPNGAGKTTLVRMLTTLSVPTSGTGRVAGFDILTHPMEVRRSMGLTGQAATVDEILTGREIGR